MKANKQRAFVSSQSNRNTMDQQATSKTSKVEGENFRASYTTPNDENDILQPLRISRERSTQNLTSGDAYTRKLTKGGISDAALAAIQKCMDHTLRAYFIHTMEKIECLSGQLLRSECAVSKMHLDLVERISRLCSQNYEQYQCLFERIDNRLGNEILEDQCDIDTCCNCDSDCECLVPETGEAAIDSPMPFDESITEEPAIGEPATEETTTEEQRPPQKSQDADNEPCFDCEEKIRKLNLELKFTREELEECLQRLKEINELERTTQLNSSSTGNDKNKARCSQQQPVKKCCRNSISDTTKLKSNEEACTTKQGIPQAPPQPALQLGSICQQKTPCAAERKLDYDSEPTTAFTRRQSGNNSEQKSSPKTFQRTQNYTSSRIEKKKNRKS